MKARFFSKSYKSRREGERFDERENWRNSGKILSSPRRACTRTVDGLQFSIGERIVGGFECDNNVSRVCMGCKSNREGSGEKDKRDVGRLATPPIRDRT